MRHAQILDDPPPSGTAIWVGGSLLLWLLYTMVFMATGGSTVLAAGRDAFANVMPLALLALMTHAVLLNHVLHRPVRVQAIWHVVLAIGFTIFWYSAIILILAVLDMRRTGRFLPSGFFPDAFNWQLFQGLTLYALVAATCYGIRGGRAATTVTLLDQRGPDTGTKTALLDRYLTRNGDDICPVETRNIATIIGAQDYSEVSTINGAQHLVRMSLSEFENRLDPARFLRVHRSTIINFDHMTRAEPAGGGRMIVHMKTGQIVQLSRAGTQLLRQFIV
jgi:two-component system, LytTR family, response regulator